MLIFILLIIFVLPIIINLTIAYKSLPKGATIATCIKMFEDGDLPPLSLIICPGLNIIILIIWIVSGIEEFFKKHGSIRIK